MPSQARRRQDETEEQAQARRAANVLSQANRRQDETPEQTQTRRAANVQRRYTSKQIKHQSIRHEAICFDERQVQQHDCGEMNVICQFCASTNFADERPSAARHV